MMSTAEENAEGGQPTPVSHFTVQQMSSNPCDTPKYKYHSASQANTLEFNSIEKVSEQAPYLHSASATEDVLREQLKTMARNNQIKNQKSAIVEYSELEASEDSAFLKRDTDSFSGSFELSTEDVNNFEDSEPVNNLPLVSAANQSKLMEKSCRGESESLDASWDLASLEMSNCQESIFSVSKDNEHDHFELNLSSKQDRKEQPSRTYPANSGFIFNSLVKNKKSTYPSNPSIHNIYGAFPQCIEQSERKDFTDCVSRFDSHKILENFNQSSGVSFPLGSEKLLLFPNSTVKCPVSSMYNPLQCKVVCLDEPIGNINQPAIKCTDVNNDPISIQANTPSSDLYEPSEETVASKIKENPERYEALYFKNNAKRLETGSFVRNGNTNQFDERKSLVKEGKYSSESKVHSKSTSKVELPFGYKNKCEESERTLDSEFYINSHSKKNNSDFYPLKNEKVHSNINPNKVFSQDISNAISLNEPLLITYTEYITGNTGEILLFTEEVIGPTLQDEICLQYSQILKMMLAKCRPYAKESFYIVFEPNKVINLASNKSAKLAGKVPIPLHSSPGHLNLLSNAIVTQGSVSEITDAHHNDHIDIIESLEEFSHPDLEILNEKELIGRPNHRLESISGGDWKLIPPDVRDGEISQINPQTHSSERIDAKKKLLIRLCKRKRSRTDLKRVNLKQIATSQFKNTFHFYSLLGGHLKSGSVITKSNSNYWLKKAGVAMDICSEERANELFIAIAGAKVVLNIFDYMRFLISFARWKQIAATDLIKQLTITHLSPPSEKQKPSHTGKRRFQKIVQSAGKEAKNAHVRQRCQSLPNL